MEQIKNSMEQIKGLLYVACHPFKEKWDRILMWIGCPSVTVHSIVDVFTLSVCPPQTGSPALKNRVLQLLQHLETLLSSSKKKNPGSPALKNRVLQLLQHLETLLSSSKKKKSRFSSTQKQSITASVLVIGFLWLFRKKKPRSKKILQQPIETSEASQSSESFCNICMDTKAQSEMFSNATVCGHQFCADCIRTYVSVKVKENIAEVKCPDPKCKGVIGPELCRSIVPKEVLERWEDALCESSILATQKFYCPFKDCSALLVDDGGVAVTSSECPNCNRLFCAQCKVAWHSGMDCRRFKSLKKNGGNPDTMLMELAKNKKWRRCPRCKFYVEKRDGCNHITCICGYHFCYGCGEMYNPSHACNTRDANRRYLI